MNIQYTTNRNRYTILIPKNEIMVVSTIPINDLQNTVEWVALLKSNNVICSTNFSHFSGVFGMSRDNLANIITTDNAISNYKAMVEDNRKQPFCIYSKIMNNNVVNNGVGYFDNTNLNLSRFYVYHTNNQKVLNYILVCDSESITTTTRYGVEFYSVKFDSDTLGKDALDYIENNADTSSYILELGAKSDPTVHKIINHIRDKLSIHNVTTTTNYTTNSASNIELLLKISCDIEDSKAFIADTLQSHGIKNEVKVMRLLRQSVIRIRITKDFDYIYTLLCELGHYQPIGTTLNLSSRDDLLGLGIDL